jgi:nitrate reductase NapAB chaperone NapD
MRKMKLLVLAALFSVSSLVWAASSEEIAELKEQMDQLQRKIEQLEENQQQQGQTMQKKIDEVVESKQIAALPESIKWVENMKIYGDFRYRYENIDSQSNGSDNHGANRNRIRARVGVKADVTDEFSLDFRLASGSADPASSNQTLQNGFTSKNIWLDRAYFDWHPAAHPGFNLYGGKMPNPFYTVDQLIWDSDVNPEGIAVNYSTPLSDTTRLMLNAGGFWMDYAADSNDLQDVGLWGAQAAVAKQFANDTELVFGGSFYDFGNLKGKESGEIFDKERGEGNTLAGNKYKYDYDILEGFAEYKFYTGDMPVALFGNYITNTAATHAEDSGWALGVKLNKAKKPGDWEFGYSYREVDADATIGALSDSDFNGGATNGKGHKFGLKYAVAKNMSAGLTYFLNEDTSDDYDDNYRRLQADLKFKF